jgi:hypothetical protein
MLTKFFVAFTVLALVAAFAGNIPVKGPVSHVVLSRPSVVSGTALKAGEYKLIINAGKVTFILDKETHEIAAKIETAAKKFDNNQVEYNVAGGQTTISAICLGGTKTRLVFD